VRKGFSITGRVAYSANIFLKIKTFFKHDAIPEKPSFSVRPAKYFYDKPLPKYLDPKIVLIYLPHPVCGSVLFALKSRFYYSCLSILLMAYGTVRNMTANVSYIFISDKADCKSKLKFFFTTIVFSTTSYSKTHRYLLKYSIWIRILQLYFSAAPVVMSKTKGQTLRYRFGKETLCCGSGSDAFLTPGPGSGIRNRFFSGSRISDPGSQTHSFCELSG
jgi:hypothetical protein